MMDLIEKARVFATAAHWAVGQVRKYTGEAYMVHPAEVANLVLAVDGTVEMVAAAYLHDVVEDTEIPLSLISRMFGVEVASLVDAMTEDFVGNRASRKAQSCAKWATASNEAKTIKLADLYSNLHDITVNDKNFYVLFRRECQELLPHLQGGDRSLYELVESALANG
jgi:guanosine-3',5'-bis(diphosphate) 3'-pyrophosphohydrolase